MGTMRIAAVSLGVFLVAVPPAAVQGQTREEVVLWTSIKDSTNPDDYGAYLDKYPDGTFAPLAKRRLETLREAQAAATAAAARQREQTARLAEANRFRFPVAHYHASHGGGGDCYGYLTLTSTSASYNGTWDVVTFTKDQVQHADILSGGLRFKVDKNWTFYLLDGPPTKNARFAPDDDAGKLRDALMERWGFKVAGRKLVGY